ncbi:MAG: plastocyanin/azurin family copper-binding protein [Nitrosopumilus sp.]
MENISKKIVLPSIASVILLVLVSSSIADAQTVPEWVKSNALWYGQGTISEAEFLNTIKFLIENDVLVIDAPEKDPVMIEASVIIPNGNSELSSGGFYFPLNLETPVGTTVTWVNDDFVPHNVQSQDEFGKVTDVFNSPPLNTGDRFEHMFEEAGVYNYHCTFHPWRVGVITVR